MFKRPTLLYKLFTLALLMAYAHPILAWAADAVAALPVDQVLAQKAIDLANQNIVLTGGGSFMLYQMIETLLGNVAPAWLKVLLPSIFSFIGWAVAGRSTGMSWGAIGLGATKTTFGSMLIHEALDFIPAIFRPIANLGIALVTKAVVVPAITPEQYLALKAKGSPLIANYHEDGSPVQTHAPVLVPA